MTKLMVVLAGILAAGAARADGKCNLTGGVDIGVCDPSAGPFSTTVDNRFFPLPVGRRAVYDGSENGATVHLEVTVLDATESVAGITTRVVEERQTNDGALVEVSRNFFAQAPDGTVCYFGEDVDIRTASSLATRASGAPAAATGPGSPCPRARTSGWSTSRRTRRASPRIARASRRWVTP